MFNLKKKKMKYFLWNNLIRDIGWNMVSMSLIHQHFMYRKWKAREVIQNLISKNISDLINNLINYLKFKSKKTIIAKDTKSNNQQ